MKLGIGFVGGGAWFNTKLGISIAYDFNTGFKVLGNAGMGFNEFTAGVAGTGYLSLSYFPGEIKDGSSMYVVGTFGEGVAGEFSVSAPTEVIQEVDGILPTANELKNIVNNAQYEAGIGVGGGGLIGVGVQGEQTLLDFSETQKTNIDLNNQTGQAPADASNVVPTTSGTSPEFKQWMTEDVWQDKDGNFHLH